LSIFPGDSTITRFFPSFMLYSSVFSKESAK